MSDDPTTPPEVLAPDSVEPPTGPHGASAAATPAADGAGAKGSSEEEVPDINSPAKIIRIGAMVKQLLEEVRGTSLDEASRGQLRDIYERSLDQLKTALSPELADELTELSFDFPEGSVPSETELRMAQSQLVGWLEGLFHGIQATLVAQQMAARQQLEGMRGPVPQIAPQQNAGPGYL